MFNIIFFGLHIFKNCVRTFKLVELTFFKIYYVKFLFKELDNLATLGLNCTAASSFT